MVFHEVELALTLFWDWIFLGLFEVGGPSTCSGLISNGGCFQSFGGLLPHVGKRSCCHFYFVSGFQNSLFMHHTQCSMQNVPSITPINRLTQPSAPSPQNSQFVSQSLSWSVSSSNFPPLTSPLDHPVSSVLFFMLHN